MATASSSKVTSVQKSPNGQNTITTYANGTSSFTGPQSSYSAPSGGGSATQALPQYDAQGGFRASNGVYYDANSIQAQNSQKYGIQPTNIIPPGTIASGNQLAINQPMTGLPQTSQFQEINSQKFNNINSAIAPYNPDGTFKDPIQQKALTEANQANNEQGRIQRMLESFNSQPTGADIYRQAQNETGILQKQQLVSDLSGQLNQITAQSQANQLQVTGQGRGIPEAIIGGQQAQIAKEAAINALPVAAQLAAAQGNLQMAEQNLNTLFKIKSDDAKNKYEFQSNVLKTVYDFADKKDQQKLASIDKQLDREYAVKQKNLDDVKDITKQALVNQAPASIMSKIAASTDLNSAVKAAGKYGGDYLKHDLLVAQIATERSQKANYDANASKTRTETAQIGLPGSGKPLTDLQVQYAGYADRISQANTIIDAKASTFAKMNYKDFLLAESTSPLANSVMNADVRQASQAMRNFITAKLRKESGASISPTEFSEARAQYFPSLGDDPTTLANKKALRDSVLQNNILGSGGAYTAPNPFSKSLGQNTTSSIPGTSIISNISDGVINFKIPGTK